MYFTCVCSCTRVLNVTVCMVLLGYSTKYPVGFLVLDCKVFGFCFRLVLYGKKRLSVSGRMVPLNAASSLDQNKTQGLAFCHKNGFKNGSPCSLAQT